MVSPNFLVDYARRCEPRLGSFLEGKRAQIEKLPVSEIDLLALKQAGVVPQQALTAKVILRGEITRKIQLKGLLVTKGAQAAIEKAGGSFERYVG